MKMIVAVIKHFRLDAVREALTEIGVKGMTIVDVKGFGRQKGHVEVYRGAQYEVKFLPKVRVEVAVDDEMLEQAIEALCTAARTGEVGDGKIFVTSLQDVIRIRTGERGAGAI